MSSDKKKIGLLFIGIVFISMISRAPITGVGSVIEYIKSDLAISNAVAGFVTTIPLLLLSFFSPFVGKLSEKPGMGNAMGFGLFLLIAGCLARSYGGTWGFFVGTAIIGGGLAIISVLLPAIIKLKFPLRIGFMTGIYTTFMDIASSLAAGFSAPLAGSVGLGWQNTLALWAAITLIVLLIWLPQCGNRSKWSTGGQQQSDGKLGRRIFKNPLAWQVTFFMGLQSLLYYAFVAWLPTMVASKGYAFETAGYFALMYQLICIPASFFAPLLCDKFKDQRVITVAAASVYLAGMTLFWLSASTLSLTIAIVLCGIGSGAAVSFAMAFFALRAGNAVQATELSGMAQCIGYLLAAPATTIMGCIFDVTQSWNIPMATLVVITAIWLCIGIKAGADKTLMDYDKGVTE